MLGEALTLWTIRLSATAFIVALTLRCSPATTFSRGNTARIIWTIGCLLAVFHFISAMTFYHGWSLAAAYEDTTAQTQAAIGLRFGGGVYFNYLFLLIWSADAIWWWILPAGYANRGRGVNLLVYGYLFFIAFNGVVVFGQGATRWIGLAACVPFAIWLAWQSRGSVRRWRHNPQEQSVANRIDQDR